MSQSVIINDKNWNGLCELREGFETVDETLERLLLIGSKPKKKKRSRKGGDWTRQKDFFDPLMLVLYKAKDHRLTSAEAIAQVGKVMDLKNADFEVLECDTVRWEKMVHWCRNKGVSQLLMYSKDEVGRGVWALTAMGITYVERILQFEDAKS